jgi:hypothetical protein
MAETVEQLQDELRAAGRRPEAVQRAGAAKPPVPDGVYLVRDVPEGVEVVMSERGQASFREVFADEPAAVRELRSLLVRAPGARARTDAETAESVARMQEKAAAVAQRFESDGGDD